jgi:hypothetical protein
LFNAPKLVGTPDSLYFCPMLARGSVRPSAYLQDFVRRKDLLEANRNMKESTTLLQIVEGAGKYDQVNLGECLFFETATRLAAAILRASWKGSGSQGWSLADAVEGRDNMDSLLPSTRRAEVHRVAREKWGADALRLRTSQGSQSNYNAADRDAVDDLGVLPSPSGDFPAESDAKGKGRKAKARAKQAATKAGDGR